MVFILLLLILILLAVAVYSFIIFRRFLTLFHVDTHSKRSKILSGCFAFVCFACCLWVFGFGAVLILHYVLINLVMDLIFTILKRLIKKESTVELLRKIHYSTILSVAITSMFIGYGFYNMHQVVQTKYEITTNKQLNKPLTIAQISDLHTGTTMDANELKTYCQEIQNENPDYFFLTGDIVDESTTKEEMYAIVTALASVKTTYGTYYVFGNHDYNKYRAEPNFTPEEWKQCLKDSGIKVLEDEVVNVGDDVVIIGRKDASQTTRKITEFVTSDMKDKFVILLDHQPKNLREAADSGVDLEFSGHTHGGQIWPTGQLAEMFGIMEKRYGLEQIGDYHIIVSSGIAGWGYPIRTSGHCEYVITKVNSVK